MVDTTYAPSSRLSTARTAVRTRWLAARPSPRRPDRQSDNKSAPLVGYTSQVTAVTPLPVGNGRLGGVDRALGEYDEITGSTYPADILNYMTVAHEGLKVEKFRRRAAGHPWRHGSSDCQAHR